MDTFKAYYADIHDPGWQSRIAALLRDRGLATFSGITGHAELVAVARRLMTIRPHRDAGPDGVTVITGAHAQGSGYAAFTDAELIPHTDGSSVPDPPGLLLLTCQQPADQGGGRGSPTVPVSLSPFHLEFSQAVPRFDRLGAGSFCWSQVRAERIRGTAATTLPWLRPGNDRTAQAARRAANGSCSM